MRWGTNGRGWRRRLLFRKVDLCGKGKMVHFSFKRALRNYEAKKQKRSLALQMIDAAEAYERHRALREDVALWDRSVYLKDGKFCRPSDWSLDIITIMTYSTDVCRVQLSNKGENQEIKVWQVCLDIKPHDGIDDGCLREMSPAEIVLDDEDRAWLKTQIDEFKEEEAAFLAAERRFLDRDPFSFVDGMTPEEALPVLRRLRQETL